MPMLEISRLTVRHGPVAAVRDVSISVAEGEIVAIIGPNGAGKTTTLMTAAGVYRPVSGSITLDGTVISGRRPELIAGAGLALVPEGRRILTTLTVAENLILAATSRARRRQAAARVDEVLSRFPALRELKDRRAGKLSGGEQQQLAIARALAGRPRLLMLDEPSLGLAPKVVDDVFGLVAGLRAEGTTVLLAEQQALRAVELADRTYVMRTGRVEVSGNRADLGDPHKLAAAYLGAAR
jgi:branched-chain amino acid transport system ATP-binding protein